MPARILASGVVFVAVFIFILWALYPKAFQAMLVRFQQVNSVISERSHGWLNAFSNGFWEMIYGAGFATGGQRAIGFSATTVNDGNYFKIIYDLGIIGLLLWIGQVASIVRRSVHLAQFPYFVAVIGFMIQMIGSNLLTFYSTALLFWYCIGRLVNIHYYSEFRRRSDYACY